MDLIVSTSKMAGNNARINFKIDTGDAELDSLVQHAQQASPLVQLALTHAFVYNQSLHAEQQALFELAKSQYSHYPQQDFHLLQNEILERIDADIAYVQELNAVLKSYPAGDDIGDVTWSLKTNKMALILEGAKDLILDDAVLTSLLNGTCPQMLDCAMHHPVILGDTDSIYGSSESTFLSAALIELNLTLLGEQATLSDLSHVTYHGIETNTVWMDYSALAHITPIPELVSLDNLSDGFFSDFSFFYSDDVTSQGLVFIHSGYAFGGQRGETRDLPVDYIGPEDCSSWVAKLTQCDFELSTIDQLFTYRISLPEAAQGIIYADWLDSSKPAAMQSIYSPVYIEDPWLDIQPGQVFAYRDFDSPDHATSAGIAGHTGIVLGMSDAGMVQVLCFSRDMPEFEGFGVREYDWQSNEAREVMFFDVNLEQIDINDVLASMQESPWLSSGTMALGEPASLLFLPLPLETLTYQPLLCATGDALSGAFLDAISLGGM